MHTHRRLFDLAKNVHGFFTGIIITSLLITAVILVQMYLLSTIISDVFISGSFTRLYLLYLLLGCILARSLLLWFREKFSHQKSIKIQSSLRKSLFNHMINLGPSYTQSHQTGQLVANITDGTNKLDDYFTRYIPSIIHIVILPVSIIVFTLFFDWMSGLIMLFTAPLILFFMFLIGTYAKKMTENQWGQLSGLSSHFLDVLMGMKTLKTFSINNKEAKEVEKKSNLFRVMTMDVLKVAFLSGMVLELAASISIALVAVQVGIRLIEGMMIYQPALFILLLAPEFYLPFRTLGAHHHAGMEGAAAAKSIFGILDQKGYGYDPASTSKNSLSVNHKPSVVFENVSFTYPGDSKPVLNSINCHLKPGTLTAVVGKSGAGKSTFAHIMLGFLHPQKGEVWINKSPLSAMDRKQWQKWVAYVPQHPHFFNGSVSDNLRMANPSASGKQIADACEMAGVRGFIENLPGKYNFTITENASVFSGGQKQRLAIARAFLKNAPLLVLDEPTSSLDPESELIITQANLEISKHCTALIIAHRLQTVQKADHILVFDNGDIVERGSHSELIKDKGLYNQYISTHRHI
ncbi:MAG: thiol reductant ABC exporter subunit CydD [Bacteroidota bacterium]